MNNGQFNSRPFDGNDLKTILVALTNGNPNSTPPDPPKPKTLTAILNTQSLNQLISDANTTMIVDKAQEEAANQPTTDNPEPPPCTSDCNPPPPPPCEDCNGAPLGHLQGYAGGLYSQTPNPDEEEENDLPVGVLANWNSKHVDFEFNRNEDGSLADYFSAKFKLSVGKPGNDEGGAHIDFGNLTAPQSLEDRRSFISENEGLLAFATSDGVKIFHEHGKPATPGDLGAFAALVSSDFAFNTNTLSTSENYETGPRVNGPPVIEPVEFCEGCEFMKWGAFVMGASFMETTGGPEPVEFERHVAVLGWWVAGDILPVGELPFTGEATYAGDAIATVATDLFIYSNIDQGLTDGPTSAWTTYVATGDLAMDWDFAKRSGNLTISKFDASHFPDNGGLSFTGAMCAPGVTSCGTNNTPGGNHFGGALNGQLPASWQNGYSSGQVPINAQNLEGFALGSFARGPENIGGGSIPQGVIGNWGVGNDHYMASGIFAGSLRP
jgi:hypothetical protein